MWSQVKDKREILLAQKNTKMRFLPRSKWALPMKSSNYWRKILEEIESKTLKVREPSLTQFSLAIPASLSKRRLNKVDDSHHDSKIKPTVEPLVRILPPSPTHSSNKYFSTQIEVLDTPNIEEMDNLISCDSRKSENSIEYHNFESEKQIESENKIINAQSLGNMNFNNLYPSLFKISQLSKISKCINNFLAHTRDRVKSGAECEMFKNAVSPEQTLDSDTEKMKKISVPKNIYNETNVQCELEEPSKVINVDREKEIKECSTARLEQKKVSFLNVENDETDSISEAEYRSAPRRRAPSIAIASALPSFGKNVSSLESSDSLDNSSFNEDFSTKGDTPEMIENTDQIMKPEAYRESDQSSTEETNLQVSQYRKLDHSLRYSGNQRKVRSKYLPGKSFKLREFQPIKTFQYWPKKSLVHILRALKVMKSSTRKAISGRRNDHLFLPTSSLQSSSIVRSVEGSFNSTITHKFTDHSSSILSDECYEEESTSTSLTSSCSYSSVRRRPIAKPSVFVEKKIPSPRFIDNSKIESDILSRQISSELEISIVSTSNQEDTSSIFKKDKFILKKIPHVDRMYQRKKSDKCLACLHSSMKLDSTNFLKFDNVDFSILSMSEGELILDEPDNIFHRRTDYNNRHELFRRETTLDLEHSDIESELLEDNLIAERVKSTELNNLADQFHSNMSLSSYAVDRKSDVGYEKKSIISNKSLISNLSVVSDRSKTASDQDDSDQAIDEGGGMEENIVESRSKFLAPCHAPLNLRPSLEPLKALRNKQARSIQSRMASLEKSTEAESDEKSEDDEVPIVVAKGKDNTEKKCISTRIESDRSTTFTGESTKESRQNLNCIIIEESLLNLDDFTDLLEQIKHQSDLREQCKANELLIADKIFSELNMFQKGMEYSLNKSSVPVSPILFDYEIVELSQKLLKEGKSIIDILCELVKIYSDRLSKRALNKRKKMNPDVYQNVEMIKRLLMLLVDSKNYLNHQQNSSNPSPSPSQKPSINSRQLRRVLPVKSYNLIAPILGLPEWHSKRWTSVRDANKLRVGSKKVITTDDRSSLKLTGLDSDTSIDLIDHPPIHRKAAAVSSEDGSESWTKKELNPYGLFITKPRRKVVIWRPLVVQDFEGYDPEATLKRRAAKITNEICTDFCQWLRNLGGFDTTIDEEVLKEMFETDFSADACRAMQMSLQELPVVPSSIAKAQNCPDAAEFQRVREQLMLDVKAENQKPRLTAFGSALPNHLKYIPPKNEVSSNWLYCEYIPEDLETMDAVWKNITDLDSVKGFINWTQTHHPNTKLPAALKHSLITKKSNLNSNERKMKFRKCLAEEN